MCKHPVPKRLFFLFLLVSLGCAIPAAQAQVKKFDNFDAAVSLFGQLTSQSSGNGITDKPSKSMGGIGSFRQTFSALKGYEVNYSYTRFSEFYSDQVFAVQNNVHEVTAAYLIHAPRFLGLQPFAAAGGGWLVFLPTTTGGQQYSQQYRPTFLYELGANYPLLTSRLGLRFQYRGLIYSTPNFNQSFLQTNSHRQTSEGALGLYLRF